MIKINRRKVNCPPSLDTSNKNLVESDYQEDDVIDALFEIQHSKCCYCEKKLKSLGSTAIWVEHLVARTDVGFLDAHGNTNWNEANAWENLLYSCSTCNRSKGTTPPFNLGVRILIDPSNCDIDPEDHVGFRINGVFIKYEKLTDLGKNTIEKLKLDKRIDCYSGFQIAQLDIDSSFGELGVALIYDDAITVESMLAKLTRLSSAHLPHASFRRKYINQKVDRFNNNELHEINQHYGKKIPPITVYVAKGYEVIE